MLPLEPYPKNVAQYQALSLASFGLGVKFQEVHIKQLHIFAHGFGLASRLTSPVKDRTGYRQQVDSILCGTYKGGPMPCTLRACKLYGIIPSDFDEMLLYCVGLCRIHGTRMSSVKYSPGLSLAFKARSGFRSISCFSQTCYSRRIHGVVEAPCAHSGQETAAPDVWLGALGM